MKGRLVLTAAFTFLAVLNAPRALADVYSPDFKSAGSELSIIHPEKVSVKDGILTITPDALTAGATMSAPRSVWNQVLEVGDATIKVKCKLSKPTDPKCIPYCGLLFTMKDINHMVEASVSSEGSYTIYKSDGDKTINTVEWTVAPSLNKGFDVWNELQVSIKGNRLTFSINGTVVKSVPIDGLSAGGMFGVTAYSTSGSTSQFKDLQVTY
jgi:hypothetical protein